MPPEPTATNQPDVIDSCVPLPYGSATLAVRRQRDKVVAATQASHDGLMAPTVVGISVAERLSAALLACARSKAPALVGHYRRLLLAHGMPGHLVDVIATGQVPDTADSRLATLLGFTAKLIERPIDGDREAVSTLVRAGLSTPAIVALAQLIAFVSYQVRLVAGLQAMLVAEAAPVATSQATGADAARPTVASGTQPAPGSLRINGFTDEVPPWAPWLPTVDLDQATPEQLAALDEMSPTARQSPYFLLLAHQSEILLHRSVAFNAIMFAPGGLPRAERELGATVESRLNGCVYCTAVHAQRFEQLARRTDVVEQLFRDPATAGTSHRERAIVNFSALLSLQPHEVGATQVQSLGAAGLVPLEVLDLVHAVALFAWANRLMLNLGEAVLAEA